MAYYRCYCFDAENKIAGADAATLDDDAKATLWGASILSGQDGCAAVEVWELDRRVIRLERVADPC